LIAAEYLAAKPEDLAMTERTSQGLGTIYTGLKLRPGQEILSTEQEHIVTKNALRFRAERMGTPVRTISLYDHIDTLTEDGLVRAVTRAVKISVLRLASLVIAVGLTADSDVIGQIPVTSNPGDDRHCADLPLRRELIARHGNDKRENRAAIQGRNPAVTGIETGVSDHIESKLLYVKPQASIMIANETLDLNMRRSGSCRSEPIAVRSAPWSEVSCSWQQL
jgi:hypothetical protein